MNTQRSTNRFATDFVITSMSLVFAATSLLASGCDNTPQEKPDVLKTLGEPNANTSLSLEPERSRRARLVMKGKDDVKVAAHVEEVKDGVRIEARVHDLKSGKYPVVVYESGDCSQPPDSLGKTFRFTQEEMAEDAQSKVSILGEVEVKEDGSGIASWQTTRGSLREGDAASLLGKPFVFYRPTEQEQTGDVIACGTIESYQSP